MKSLKSRYEQYLESGVDRRVALPILVVTVCTLFVFQNCADPLQLANEDSLSVADSLPFAFDVSADHISYMSCSDMPADFPYRSFYTFRVGAYDDAGIKFTDDFLSRTGKYKASERAAFVPESTASAGASVQLAVRQKTNYQGPLISSSTPIPWHDYQTMLAPLDSPLIVQKLSELTSGDRINYFAGIAGLDNRIVEGSVRFTQTESLAADVREKLLNTTLLTLTFTDQLAEDELVARGVTSYSTSEVYGRGYEVEFKGDRDNNPVGGLRRSLSRINELDLMTRKTIPATWECKNEMSFLIIRKADLGQGTTPPCTPGVPGDAASAEVKAAYAAIRKVLRPEDWLIDAAAKCAVPRLENYCYGNDPARTVVYQGTCDPTKGECPHFVSVCVRTSGN